QQWTDIESKFEIKSVYYIFASAKRKKWFNLQEWLIEPSYDLLSNHRLIEECKKLMAGGNKVGIHGSYSSAGEPALFQEEKHKLETCIGSQITKGRQHWLQFYENKTPYIYENSGIREDSTLGFNDISGFRSGVASKYNPYDHKNERAFSFKEIPLVIMDSHLYDYGGADDCNSLGWFFDATESVKKFEISVNWHQRTMGDEYGWKDSFTKIAEKLYDKKLVS
ncbi:MAG: hypothetical protein COV73_04945, partial [Candidatus Omnitrophica bacterium CG11_big_fil_rev_8_21_14_0_20_43_6]